MGIGAAIRGSQTHCDAVHPRKTTSDHGLENKETL
jgi:hypothetical protein